MLNTITKYNKIYKSKGFTVIKDFVSKNEAKKLEHQTINFIKKRIKKYNGRDINFVDNKKVLKIALISQTSRF